MCERCGFEWTPLGIYENAIRLAASCNQVIGEKNNYYITLSQLESLIIMHSDDEESNLSKQHAAVARRKGQR